MRSGSPQVAVLRLLAAMRIGYAELGKKSVLVLPSRRGRGGSSGYLAAVVTIRDEAQYLREWISFHLLSGVEHLYVYDNGSVDDPLAELQPFIDRGAVTFIDWSIPWSVVGSLEAHHLAYADAAIRFGAGWRWMTFLDADEFLFAVSDDQSDLSHLATFLRTLERFPVLTAWWTMFGSSGHSARPEGLVIDNFRKHAPFPFLTAPKLICDPSSIRAIWSSHMLDTDLGRGVAFDERGKVVRHMQAGLLRSAAPFSNTLRLHHYYVRSLDDWNKKVSQRKDHWPSAKVAKLEERGRSLELNSTLTSSSIQIQRFVGPVQELMASVM